ncbi:hypothetical protein Xmau_00169 [Xenorhabdus mauleonii]|uniref:Uncharacterized protein n=1 Tax=Xenorhabdus mauleonii TaxID=351675 RepID=A0A1I3N4W4_9GAMM|nr:hypothetical protein Xmau_00169 [Xenorhabdus mauleonii]SFJ04281.1 hypothetical protein SAMN05421680_10591 [Xenorhabdus mauleonii]
MKRLCCYASLLMSIFIFVIPNTGLAKSSKQIDPYPNPRCRIQAENLCRPYIDKSWLYDRCMKIEYARCMGTGK